MNCGVCTGVKLLEHTKKIAERVLKRQIRTLVNLDKMQFGFMPGKGSLYTVTKQQEEYQNKDKKLYMCFMDKKPWKECPKVIEWSMRQRSSVIGLYGAATTTIFLKNTFFLLSCFTVSNKVKKFLRFCR